MAARKTADILAQTISVSQAAEMTGLTKRWVQLRVTEGFIEPSGRGRTTLAALGRGIVNYYQDLRNRESNKAAATRGSDARARLTELQIAEREGRLLPIEECEAVVAEIAAKVLSEFSGLGARVTRDLALRRKIETEVDRVLDAIRSHAEKQGAALRSGGVDMDKE